MSSFKTGNKKLQPGTVIIGENGLPVDTIATISSSYLIVAGVASPLVYATGLVTVPGSVDLVPVRYHKARYTGRLILRTADNNIYFIDKPSVTDATKQFSIYLTADQLTSPASIDLSVGWTIAEAEIVNRLATTSMAKIDQIEFQDMQFNLELDGDPVTVIDENGDLVDFATEATQQENNQELQDINTELDGIHSDLNSQFDETQTILQSEFDETQVNQLAQTVELQAANASLDAIEDDTDAIRIAVQSIEADIDVPLSTRATEATQLDNNAELQSINSELDQVNSNLDSIETKLDTANSNLDSIELKLDAVNSSLDAIESDADATRIAVQSIDTDIDVALSTRASEVTQVANNTELQQINVNLEINNNLYSRVLPILTNANFLKLANFDSIEETFLANVATLTYKEDGFEIAKAIVTFNSPTSWNIVLERYVLDDDGSILEEDDDTNLLLE